jgi:DNA-binding IclR family transcriptional regulator
MSPAPARRAGRVLIERMTALDRGLDILSYVGAHGPITAEVMARDLEMPLSTIYRYMNSLRDRGYLAPYEGHYDLGPQMMHLLHPAVMHRCLAHLAAPIMFDLVARTRETALLTVLNGSSATCIETIEPHRAVRLSFRRGVSLPLHAGASAKPLLAYMPGHLIDEYLYRQHSADATEVDRIRAQLRNIRRRGMSVTTGELDSGALAVGVPVFWNGDVAACLSVAGPRSRFAERKLREAGVLVRAGGRTLSEALSDQELGDTVEPVDGEPLSDDVWAEPDAASPAGG